MAIVAGVDPRTATRLPTVTEATTPAEVGETVAAAVRSVPALEESGRQFRAMMLDTMADEAEAHRDELVSTAERETGFTPAKLNGELTRATFQLRFFGQVLREGSYLEATIDPAAHTTMGPRPDLRRLLVPVGAVAVFGASNFPFAFSVLGGDTASALAAGCPVVVKAHDSHPATAKLSHDLLVEGARRAGSPGGVVGIVYGREAGTELVAHPDVRAVGFTGSLTGGKALLEIIGRRTDPIPFYGELSSINPVIVTPAAAAERGASIGSELVGSFTLGAGQLCTKPGVVLVPDNSDGDAVVAAVRAALSDVAAQPLLNERIFSTYMAETGARRRDSRVATIGGPLRNIAGFCVDPVAFETDIDTLDRDLVDEIFGPVTVIVRYRADDVEAAVVSALGALPRSLTVTLQHGDDEVDLIRSLTRIALPTAGRVIFNGFPTGVAVSWAQHHGGPWPATNSLHTSVGATAIRRFLRPVTFQDAPQEILPTELRDDYDRIPRRIDGVWRTPGEA